jgi:hypothetical protein
MVRTVLLGVVQTVWRVLVRRRRYLLLRPVLVVKVLLLLGINQSLVVLLIRLLGLEIYQGVLMLQFLGCLT